MNTLFSIFKKNIFIYLMLLIALMAFQVSCSSNSDDDNFFSGGSGDDDDDSDDGGDDGG